MALSNKPVTHGAGSHQVSCVKKDVFKDSPVRFLGFTNELGTAVGEVCAASTKGIVKNIPVLSYIPSLGYIAADVFDKYKKGEDGTGKKPSVKMGARELISQSITSIAAPTAVILGTRKAVAKLSASVGPKLPNAVKNLGTRAGEFLKNNKLTGKVFAKAGMPAKIAGIAISLAALVAATKPIDNAAEKFMEKVVDPIMGIKHSKAEHKAKPKAD